MKKAKTKNKRARRERAHMRIRRKVLGTAERPRLSVFKSSRYIYAQLINDEDGHTLAQASSREAAIAKKSGVEKVVFDRGGYLYHGKVKDLAEGARANGLEF